MMKFESLGRLALALRDGLNTSSMAGVAIMMTGSIRDKGRLPQNPSVERAAAAAHRLPLLAS